MAPIINFIPSLPSVFLYPSISSFIRENLEMALNSLFLLYFRSCRIISSSIVTLVILHRIWNIEYVFFLNGTSNMS